MQKEPGAQACALDASPWHAWEIKKRLINWCPSIRFPIDGTFPKSCQTHQSMVNMFFNPDPACRMHLILLRVSPNYAQLLLLLINSYFCTDTNHSRSDYCLWRCAGEYVCEILATESALDSAHSHIIFNLPVVILGSPCGDCGGMSLNHSGNRLIISREIGQRVRQEVLCPSLNRLGNLLTLQVCHDLLLPFEKVILSKPREAIWGTRQVGRHGTEIRELRRWWWQGWTAEENKKG